MTTYDLDRLQGAAATNNFRAIVHLNYAGVIDEPRLTIIAVLRLSQRVYFART